MTTLTALLAGKVEISKIKKVLLINPVGENAKNATEVEFGVVSLLPYDFLQNSREFYP